MIVPQAYDPLKRFLGPDVLKPNMRFLPLVVFTMISTNTLLCIAKTATVPLVQGKITVQITMLRFPFTRPLFELADRTDLPGKDEVPEPDKVVPDSFADWLARPSQTITSESQPEQGIFAGMMDECLVQVIRVQSMPRN
jgi:hypothetical protein